MDACCAFILPPASLQLSDQAGAGARVGRLPGRSLPELGEPLRLGTFGTGGALGSGYARRHTRHVGEEGFELLGVQRLDLDQFACDGLRAGRCSGSGYLWPGRSASATIRRTSLSISRATSSL